MPNGLLYRFCRYNHVMLFNGTDRRMYYVRRPECRQDY